MNKKTVIATLSTVTLLSLGGSPVFAQRLTTQNAATSSASGQRVAAQEQRITDAKTRADNEINRRVTSLTALTTRINDMKRLSTDSKSTLSSQIQSDITDLTTLKTKIDGDTDVTTLKTDIQSIVADFRIYALFVPKTHIMAAADIILQATDTFSDIQTKLQTKIQEAQAAGKDTSAMNVALNDMQTKVTDAKSQANNAVSTVTPLVPDKTTNYKPALQTARVSLQTARHDLDDARKDAREVIQLLKQGKISSSSAVPVSSSSAVTK